MTLSTSERQRKRAGGGVGDPYKNVFLLRVEEPALDTSLASLEVSKTIALCFEHCLVRREVLSPHERCCHLVVP